MVLGEGTLGGRGLYSPGTTRRRRLHAPSAVCSHCRKKSLLQFCDQIDFRRLEVERAEPDADPPAVSFRVSFVQKGTINLCDAVERSEFARRDGKWLYTRGDVRYEAPRE